VVAGKVAEAVGAEKLILLTDIEGVKGRNGELIATLSVREAEALIQDGTIAAGMIPKIECCLQAGGDVVAHSVASLSAAAWAGGREMRPSGASVMCGHGPASWFAGAVPPLKGVGTRRPGRGPRPPAPRGTRTGQGISSCRMAEPASAPAPPDALRDRYRDAFRAWLARRDEQELGTAYALGREAVSTQASLLELAEEHHRCTQAAVHDVDDPVRRAELLEAAGTFFGSCGLTGQMKWYASYRVGRIRSFIPASTITNRFSPPCLR